MKWPREIVLPSGRFARLRRLTGADFLEAQKLIGTPANLNFCFVLITLAVVIDDEPVTYDQLLDLDLQDVMPLQKEINLLLTEPAK